MFKKIVSLFNIADGNTTGVNPALLLCMGGNDGNDMMKAMACMQMMGGNGGNMGNMNPLLLMSLMDNKGDKDIFSTIMMMSAFSGGANPFGNMFGNIGNVQPATPQQQPTTSTMLTNKGLPDCE